ncbi:MAG: hypothetical protein EXR50_01765 [Dehalococcoidia bacterium]|nr:hypothetical protein [Dehalococcoidia bacterium]
MTERPRAAFGGYGQVLSFSNQSPGIQKGSLNLVHLFPERHDLDRFEKRLQCFLSCDPSLNEVVWKVGSDELCFLTESLVPTAPDDRQPVLLLVGNPAPHSVLCGLPFSYERDHREHRFWVALRETGFLQFPESDQIKSLKERNEARKEALFSLRYRSCFRLGIAVYFAMPSPASGKGWAGVAGLRRLFGAPALRLIAAAEHERLRQIVKGFNHGTGAVLAFQSDAYEGLRLQTDPRYSLVTVLDDLLEAKCKLDSEIPLFGGPPTRSMNWSRARAALSRVKHRLLDGI